MHKKLRTFTLPVVTVLAIALVAVFGTSSVANPGISTPIAANPAFPAGSTMAKLHDAGALRVGTRYDHPGLSARNLKGQQEGFEIDMVEYIAANLGLKPDQIAWTEANSANREQFLVQDKVDMVVATYTASDKRKQVISFAGPYFDLTYDMVVAKGNPKQITDPQTPDGVKVCSTVGGTVSVYTRKDFPKTDLIEFDVSSKCIDALLNGSVDALITHAPIGIGYVGQDPDNLQMAGAKLGNEAWSIGITKGDTEYCRWLDHTIDQFYADGSAQKSWDAYLGRYAELPISKPEFAECS